MPKGFNLVCDKSDEKADTKSVGAAEEKGKRKHHKVSAAEA